MSSDRPTEIKLDYSPCGISVFGDTIAIAGSNLTGDYWDGNISLININDSKSISTRQSSGVCDIDWSADGDTLYCVGDDAKLYLWQKKALKSNSDELPISFTGHSDCITSVQAIGHEGSKVVTGSWDGTVKLWDTQQGQELMSFTHSGEVNDISWSQKALATACNTGQVYLLQDQTVGNISKGGNNIYFTLTDPATSLQWAPSHLENILVVGTEAGEVRAYDVRQLSSPFSSFRHDDGVHTLSFSPDGSALASGSDDYSIRITGFTRSNSSSSDSSDSSCFGFADQYKPFPSNDYVRATVWKDEKTLLATSWDNTLKIIQF